MRPVEAYRGGRVRAGRGAWRLDRRLVGPEDAPRLPLMAARTTHALSKSDPKLVASMVGAVGAIWIVGYTAMAEH